MNDVQKTKKRRPEREMLSQFFEQGYLFVCDVAADMICAKCSPGSTPMAAMF